MPGGAEHRDETTPPLELDPFEFSSHAIQLPTTANKRGVESSLKRREACAGGALPVAGHFPKRLPLELQSDDGGSLDQIALLLGKPVEPRTEERVDR